MATSHSPHASTLCESCGLCCSGVVFSYAKAEPEDVPGLAAAGLVVDGEGKELKFWLPCRHQRGSSCSIYEQRFVHCRAFRCALLKRLDAGEVALPEAQRTVAEAKAMVDRVAAIDPRAAFVPTRMDSIRAGTPPPEAGAAAAAVWIASLALDLFLDRHFRNKPLLDNKVVGAASPGGMDA